MNEDLWLQFKLFFIDFVRYGLPTIALILSILSYKDSRKANKIRKRLTDIEEKLKNYELEEKEKEREEASKATVEARIVEISKRNYKMKVWNSGKATAYNVDFIIPEEAQGTIWRDKVPYEFLETGKGFEERVMVYDGTPNKLKITITWTDIEGTPHSKEQLLTI